MELQLTAGAQRAFAEARKWSGRDDSDEMEAPALLLGLLAESEYRAAITLAKHGIDAQAIGARWPALTRRELHTAGQIEQDTCVDRDADTQEPLPRFSPEVAASLAAISRRLHEFPQPLALGTEHLLLGLAAAEHEVAVWLRRQGVDPDALEEEIRREYGVSTDPLPYDDRPVAKVIEEIDEIDDPVSRQIRPESEPLARTQRPPPNPQKQETSPQERIHALRVVDAAANRAREGLRVVEDYVRFVLDDRHLTDQMKQLRHELTAVLAQISPDHRLAARDTRADVGTELTTPSERCRADSGQVLAANFTRLQEALRSLEEFGKIINPEIADRLEQIRYRTYTLQKAVQTTLAGLEKLADARLYVLIDGGPSADQFQAVARSLVEAGVHVLQLRDKRLYDRELLARARLLRQITRQSGTLLIINDRPDLAALARADGVHVGQEELSVKDARTVVGPDALVGVSTHSIQQARQAVLDGANYLGVGPTFPSGTKHFDEFPGLELLRAVAAEIRLPAFAIGGIELENLPEVLATGLRRIAVSGAVTTADDPGETARALLTELVGYASA